MAGGGKISGKHVLLALLAFFGVIIAANAIFITLALKSFPGETEEHPYLKGVNYNKTLAERAKQAALGWRAEVVKAEKSGAGAAIGLRLFDAADRPLLHLRVDGALQRPAYNREDTTLTFKLTNQGVYLANVELLTPGAWNLSAVAIDEKGERFEIEAQVIIE